MDRATSNSMMRDCHTKKFGVCATIVMLGLTIGSVLLAYAAFALATPVNDATAQQMIIVFRHGDRTPTETYPADPYRTHEWPGGWGALTKKGMLQMYNTGLWIRKEYDTIIDRLYQSSNALVQSSYADRCIMSAQALLAGLYSPDPEDAFLPDLRWRPVPVHSTPRHLDKVIVVKAPCPRLDEALKEAYVNESIKSGARLAEYYKELSLHTGQNMTTITDVEFLYNTLEIEEQHGLQLPEWTKRFYNEKMRDIAARSLAIFTSNTLQQRLRGGPLLKEILSRMRAFHDGSDQRRAYFYSAHDITLVNIMRTMGFTSEFLKPDYGAALILELRSISTGQDREVKVLYLNNTETSTPHLMTIPNCGTPCLLGTLTGLWKDIIPDDWDTECLL